MLRLKLQYSGHLMQRADSLEKTLMLGKIEGERRRGWQDEMVGWHHWLNGHESEKTPGVGDGQGGLACCSPRGHKELDTTECLNWTEPLPLSGNFFPSYCPDSRYLSDGSPDWKLQHLPKTSPPFLYYFPITPVTITTVYSLAIYYAEWLFSVFTFVKYTLRVLLVLFAGIC